MSGQAAAQDPLLALADPLALSRGLFEHAPVPYAVFTREGRFVVANPAYRAMFGREPPVEYDLFADEQVAAWGLSEQVRRAMRGDTVRTGVIWFDPAALKHVEVLGANRVAFSCTMFPLRDAAGDVQQLVITYKDVTSELSALQTADDERINLQRSEAELRAMFELSAVGMSQVDLHTGHFLRVNQRLCELTGYSAEQLRCMTFGELTHPEDRARDLQAFERMLSGEQPVYQIEKRYLSKGGGVTWLQVTGALVLDQRGTPGRVVMMHVDLSHHRRVEEQAKAIAENATTPLLMLDARQHCVFMNPAAEQMTGFSLAEVSGAPLHDFIHHTRPDGSRFPIQDCPIDRALPERRQSQGEDVFVHRDGHFYPVSFTASPLLDAAGAAQGTVIEVRDTTLERLAQVERDRLLHELEQAVRVRDDFLSIAGHEVRTPLTALLLNLQTLTRSAAHDPQLMHQPRLLSRLQKTQENAERLQRLVEELLDVSRIASGRLRLASEQVELRALVRAVASRLGDQVLKAGTSLLVTAGEPLWGMWDRFRLEQVVSNLITNALKYGEGRPIEITLRRDAGWAVLSVRDHGIGIAPEDHARIFERFERAVSSRHYGGLGLGLWIARQVVEASAGTIGIESTPNEGSCFTVRLPTEAMAPADVEDGSKAP